MYVCMYVCMDVCMYGCMYVWMYVCMYGCIMYVCMSVCLTVTSLRMKFTGLWACDARDALAIEDDARTSREIWKTVNCSTTR